MHNNTKPSHLLHIINLFVMQLFKVKQSWFNSVRPIFLLLGQVKCIGCGRFLRPGLFVEENKRCNACVRKQKYSNSFATKAKGYQTSVNNTFVVRRVPATANQIDPTAYLQSISNEIAKSLRQSIQLHTTLRWVLTLTVTF